VPAYLHDACTHTLRDYATQFKDKRHVHGRTDCSWIIRVVIGGSSQYDYIKECTSRYVALHIRYVLTGLVVK